MRLFVGQASAKLTLLSRLSATNGATNSQGLFPLFHDDIITHRQQDPYAGTAVLPIELSAFQAAPRKTIIAENSIHTIKPNTAASPP
jgi:hypothetical protein